MSNVVLKNGTGRYFVQGAGFTGDKSKATRLTPTEAECTIGCAVKFGDNGVVSEQDSASWAVVYIRKDFVGPDGVHGAQKDPNASLKQVDPSKRRFATRDEADAHGARFRTRKADKGDEQGTAGHIGFYVVETGDPVNAKVNWKSGLTNPVS